MNAAYWSVQAVVIACGIWVLFDTRKHKIGKTEGGGLFNMSAPQWGVATVALWIVGFPAYVIKRRSLIERAASQPVEPGSLGTDLAKLAGTAALLVVLFGGWSVPAKPAELPACGGPEVGKLLEQIAANAAKAGSNPGASIGFSERIEVSVDAKPPQRHCTAIATAAGKAEKVRFRVSWQDQAAGSYTVQIEGVSSR